MNTFFVRRLKMNRYYVVRIQRLSTGSEKTSAILTAAYSPQKSRLGVGISRIAFFWPALAGISLTYCESTAGIAKCPAVQMLPIAIPALHPLLPG